MKTATVLGAAVGGVFVGAVVVTLVRKGYGASLIEKTKSGLAAMKKGFIQGYHGEPPDYPERY